jgi:hypothetical protein
MSTVTYPFDHYTIDRKYTREFLAGDAVGLYLG